MEYQIEDFIVNSNLLEAYNEIESQSTKDKILKSVIKYRKGCDGNSERDVIITDIILSDSNAVIEINNENKQTFEFV